jgi:hypothetical protein
MPPLNRELDVDELVPGLFRERLGQQSNFFSDFQFGLPAGTKNGVVAPAPLLAAQYIRRAKSARAGAAPGFAATGHRCALAN